MSAAEALRAHVQSLLARGLSTPEVAREAGIVGASEIWGGVQPRDRPGWYLWARGRCGAYSLELDEAAPIARDGAPLSAGRLSIRYYPCPSDPEYATFSPEERALVATGWIDETGAPEVLRAHEAPPAFFALAALDLVVRDVGDTAAVGLSTLDRLRWRYAEDWTGASPPLGTVRRRRGDRTRDVPAWALAWPVFSLLAALVAQVERRPASRLIQGVQPGFDVVHRGETVAHEDADDVLHRELLLLFDHAEACDGDVVARSLLDPAAAVVTDVQLTATGCAHAAARAARPGDHAPVVVSPAWFPRGPAPRERLACC